MRTHHRVGGRDEGGFTLVEVLVVVIVIAVLAAIAIPMFLSHRQKSLEASMKSDLRNAAHFMETYFADQAAYPADIAELPQDLRFGNGTQITVEATAAEGTYCLRATNPGAVDPVSFDSDRGGVLPRGQECS